MLNLNININIVEKLPKTFNLGLNKKTNHDLIEVLISLSLVNKNLYNTTLFVIKNLYSAYDYNKTTKTYNLKLEKLLHINQSNIINFINNEIVNFNKLRLQKYSKKKTKLNKASADEQKNINDSNNNNNLSDSEAENKSKKRKLKDYTEFKPFTNNISDDVYKQLLNLAFLQYIVEKYSKKQSLENGLIVSDYDLLPGRIRQGVIIEAIDNFIIYYKSTKAFNEKCITSGRPSLPRYKAKNTGKTFEFPGIDLGKSHKLIKLKYINHLYKDYDKKIKLSKEEINAYQKFSYKDLLDDVRKVNNISSTEKPLLLRFVPRSKSLKIETVFNTEIKIDTSKILGKTINAIKSSEDFNNKKYKNLLSSKNSSTIKALKTIPEEELLNLNISGIDLGITNILSMSYYLGSDKNNLSNSNQADKLTNLNYLTRGQIYSAKDYTRKIDFFNRKLDSIQKSLADKVVEDILNKKALIKLENEKLNKSIKKEDSKEIKLNKKNNPVLTKAEILLLHEYQKTIYDNVKYRRVLDKKNNFVNDYIHKLTSNVVSKLIANKVDLVIVGKNLGWKTNSNMGKLMNRAFYSIPHAQIINVLKYKCYENNILLVTTEESYTSQTSFINDAKLKQFDRNNNTYVEQNEYIDIYQLNDKIDYTKNENIEQSSIDNNINNVGKVSKIVKNKLNKKPGPIKTTNLNISNVDNNQEYSKHKYTEKITNFGGLRDPKNTRKFNNINYDKDNNKGKYTFIHSDLNGAYNIIRKIIDIKYKKPYCSKKCDIIYTNILFNSKIKQFV